MIGKMTLRTKILFLVSALICVNIAGSSATLWHSRQITKLYEITFARDLAALTAALELESALTSQRGFVTYYSLSLDPKWLEQLEQNHETFESWLRQARESAYMPRAFTILNDVEEQYIRYILAREGVINLYREGNLEAGARRHWDIRDSFHSILSLVREYKILHEKSIENAKEGYARQASIISGFAWVALPSSAGLGLLLTVMLLNKVFGPIRSLTRSGDRAAAGESGDEVQALSRKVRGLITDVDSARTKLEASREHLLQAEKFAQLGKLAAGVAHSIRNPLTSVKMRLFTLERTLDLDDIQREDFEVVSEEIGHIDTIVRNFLEFARPPKLKMRRINPSDVIDMSLQLVRHRFESHGIEVSVVRDGKLPDVVADPEQLKEVFANLLFNACDAMPGGGSIAITEETGVMEPTGHVAVIRIEDTGPGVSEAVADSIFEPFFSTKEEGSGLGLSIARRIIEDHGGWLSVTSAEGSGATFTIALPCDPAQRGNQWLQS